MEVKLDGWKCERCEYSWPKRRDGNYPKICPKCRSYYWDRARKEKKE